ncbi:hypothetical protein GR212_15380 [Rhizobium lusitanum]|uniref:Prohead serine protease domain-containing protein n=1 Tax=Rhizobium lusitanum TaxID=293958 RepID=A0A6L9U4U6_9HYPH|nr:HK97 family phage prohead protease [Rhizobium lusitanum]NEI70965.1 hypothetical protein [Rhizobium lusitanum]
MALKFKKASADEARAKRKEHVKDVAGGVAVVKGFRAPPSWNDDTRSARFIMSTENVDRYRDIVVQNGIDTTNFEANPQGLLFHNSRAWPIGNWSAVTKVLSGRPKRTEGVLNFLPEGTDEDADRAARHVKAGSIRTVSIGFIPDWNEVDFILDEDEDWTGGFRFNKCELIECSLVPIPAQPDALVKDAGGDMKLARDLIEDILDTYTKTPEGLLVPVDAYAEKHFELGGHRTSIIVDKSLLPNTKFVAPTDMKIAATSDDEAKAYVGAKVALDPAHSENKDVLEFWSKDTGEIIASWIVLEGEFKGAHALAVEFLTDHGVSGMIRGAKAERFLLVKDSDESSEDEDEPDDQDDSEVQDVDEGDLDEEKDVVKEVPSLKIKVSVGSDIDQTKKQVEELESVVDRVIGKIGKLFGKSKEQQPAPEKRDPVVDIQPEIKEPPTVAQIAAAKANAAALRERLISKGMIAAE